MRRDFRQFDGGNLLYNPNITSEFIIAILDGFFIRLLIAKPENSGTFTLAPVKY
jgi:hypothetical protein